MPVGSISNLREPDIWPGSEGISRNRTYIGAVDQMRAGFALLVMFYHGQHWGGSSWPLAHNPLTAMLVEGHTGVGAFMVLSGFIFMQGTIGVHVDWRRFLRNRILRIYPLYLVVVVFGVSTYRREVSFDIAVGLLPLPIFGMDRIGAFGAMTWAVAIECQFYLLFPVLHGLLRSHGRGFLIRLIVLAAALRIAAGMLSADVQALSYWTIAGRLDQFLLGMLAGQYYGENPDRCRRLLAWQFPAAIALVLAALQGFNHLGGWPVHQWWKALWPTAEGLMWTYFILCYIGAARWLPGLLSQAAETVGRISYSIYLLHLVIVRILVTHGWSIAPFRYGPYNAFATTLLITLPATLAIAWLSYTTIEAPFLSLRSRYVGVP